MALPQLNSCCACCSLKTGCLVLGWLVCFFSAIHFIPTAKSDTRSRINPDYDFAIEADVFLNLIVAIVLLIGVYKGKAGFLVPYLVLSVIEIFAYLLFCLILLFASGMVIGAAVATDEISKSDKDAIPVAIAIIFSILGFIGALKVYFFLVVKSYYNELKNGFKGQNLQMV